MVRRKLRVKPVRVNFTARSAATVFEKRLVARSKRNRKIRMM